MSVVIAMLRGVNVGGKNVVKMEALREVCGALGCTDVQTYIQSGNLVFGTKERSLPALTKRLEDAIEKAFGFRAPVVLRTTADLRKVIAALPFLKQAKDEPGKVHVVFLYATPNEPQRQAVRAMQFSPELISVGEREVYVYYPLGAGQSKLRWGPIDKALGTAGTARNWNTVEKLLAIAEGLE